MALGARDAERGGLSVSELLPLRWEAGDEPARGWTLVEDDFEVMRDRERVSANASPVPAKEREAGA